MSAGRNFYYRVKDYHRAREEFQKVLELDPDNRDARRYLKRLEKKIASRPGHEKTDEVKQKAEKEKVEKKGPEEDKEKKAKPLTEEKIIKKVEGELSLQDCIDIAIKNSTQLKVAEKQVELSRNKVNEAYRNLFPAASLSWTETTEGKIFGEEYTGRKYSAQLQQPVFRGGELINSLSQARTNLQIAQTQYQRIKAEIILLSKMAYYSLQKAYKVIEEQKTLRSEAKPLVDYISKSYDQGACSKAEFLYVNSQFSQIDAQLSLAESELELSKLALLQALSLDPKGDIEIIRESSFKRIFIDYQSCLNVAYEHRPELKINELAVKFAEYGKKIANAKAYPNIDLTGSFGEAGEAFEGTQLGLDPEWYVGAKISWSLGGSTLEYSPSRQELAPTVSSFQGTAETKHNFKFNLLDNFKFYTDKTQAEVSYLQAQNELEKAKHQIAKDVKKSYFDYRKGYLQLEAALARISYKEKELDVMKIRMEMDDILVSDYMKTMIELYQEKGVYAQSLSDYYTAIANINWAIGVYDYFKL
jgi:outer membrane protein